jgi:hypothetical protein
MPSQSMKRCAAVDMRSPFPHRVHLGGGLIPALPGHSNKFRPLRVSASADIILSEYKEPAKGEDGSPWVFNVSTRKIFGLFFKCVVTVACSATLVFMCHLGITYYHSVSHITSIISLFYYALVLFNNNAICVQVFQFLSATAPDNIIAVLLLLLGLSVKTVLDKIDAAQVETAKRIDAAQVETAKRIDAAQVEIAKRVDAAQVEIAKRVDAAQVETKKELQSQSRLITQILTSLARMETNIAWMRGDHGVVNLKHGQSDQGTKSSMTESWGDEDSFATNV